MKLRAAFVCVAVMCLGGAAARADEVWIRADRDVRDSDVVVAQFLAGLAPVGLGEIAPLAASSVEVHRLRGTVQPLPVLAEGNTERYTIADFLSRDGARVVWIEVAGMGVAHLFQDGVEVAWLWVPEWSQPHTEVIVFTSAPCTDQCGAFAYCVPGKKCLCLPGYQPLFGPGANCQDVDECATGACGPNATCTNIPGGFRCQCNDGFVGAGGACVNEDECMLGTHTCDPAAECVDETPGYTCTCPAGWTGNGMECTPPIMVMDGGAADASSGSDASTGLDASTNMDGSVNLDAGALSDAAMVSDASSQGDASTAADASTATDASTAADASTAVDASTAADASTAVDASSAADASNVADASMGADASTTADASMVVDAGMRVDGGTARDAGATAGRDGGGVTVADAAAGDGGEAPRGGCACHGTDEPIAAAPVMLLAAWMARATRRRRKDAPRDMGT